ncbi:protein kinase domain-containing protein [Sorangium sp. So ce1128]
MGQVWEAQDLALDRRVAVKLLASGPTADSAATARFEREARVLAKLRSPHIVEVYDVGAEQDLRYLVMELLEGEDLGDIGPGAALRGRGRDARGAARAHRRRAPARPAHAGRCT